MQKQQLNETQQVTRKIEQQQHKMKPMDANIKLKSKMK